MYLTPAETDRLQVFVAAEMARRALAAGLKLNAPEATALICDEMHVAARSGASYDQVLEVGRRALRVDQLIDGVADLIEEIRLEVLLDEGTRLVVLRRPWE
jgi:urease gamma subunit